MVWVKETANMLDVQPTAVCFIPYASLRLDDGKVLIYFSGESISASFDKLLLTVMLI
jgi:hypothetical protein